MDFTRSMGGTEDIGGEAGAILKRQLAASYPAGSGRDRRRGLMQDVPNPRTVSNTVCVDNNSNGSESSSLPKLTAMACKLNGVICAVS